MSNPNLGRGDGFPDPLTDPRFRTTENLRGSEPLSNVKNAKSSKPPVMTTGRCEVALKKRSRYAIV